MGEARRETTPQDAVTAYKSLLSTILERRPSGTRQRLATALARNRSFVSQITSTAYATPVPAAHLETLFAICHFSPEERRRFLSLYGQAHPRHAPAPAMGRQPQAVQLPDLGDAARNRKLHGLVSGFVREIVKLIDEENGKGKRR